MKSVNLAVNRQVIADNPHSPYSVSKDGSAAPGQHMYLVLALVGYSIIASEVVLSQRTEGDRPGDGTFPILFGYISYRIRIVLYLNVS